MVGTTLRDIRKHIEELASEQGRYRLVCARTGTQPVPVVDKRFPDRETAALAAAAAERYRSALRRYDPRAPYYDVIACERPSEGPRRPHTACDSESAWSFSAPILDGGPRESGERRRVSFCHDVAAAVFEALAAGEYEGVESSVMDAYFDLAERLSDPDDLCLCLLESIAVELDARLDPGEQADLLTEAARRLGPIEGDEDPVDASLTHFEDLGILGGYSAAEWAEDPAGVSSLTVDIDGYALSATDDRLPVLPIVLDLSRRRLDRPLTSVRATGVADGWRVTIERAGVPDGLACATIGGEQG